MTSPSEKSPAITEDTSAVTPVAEPTDHISYTKYNVAVVLFMTIGSLSYGYSGSIISTTLGQPSFIKYMGLDTRSDAKQLEGAIVSLYFVGGIFGTFLGSFLADKYGRKMAIATGAVILIISGALLAGSVHVGMFIAFRFFNGMAGYMLVASIPLWIIEIVPPRSRGWLVDLHPIVLVFGYVMATWTGYGFFYYHGSGNEWRPPLAMECFFPIVLLCGMKWMPESPRYLLSKDRFDEAWEVLSRLHSRPGDSNNMQARKEFFQIKKQIELDKQFESSYISLIKNPSYRRRLVLASGWIYLIQSSGILVIISFSPTVYSMLGYSPSKQLLLSSLWLTVTWFANFASAWTIDLIPRPRYVAIGIFLCLVCLVIEAGLIAKFVRVDVVPNTTALQAAVAILFIFSVAYGLFLDGSMFVFVGEIYPNHLRSKGVNLALATHALTNIVYTAPAPTAFANIGWKYYLVFICILTLSPLIILRFFPDTRRLPLEEIAKLFGDQNLVAVYQQDLTNPEIVHEKYPEIEHNEVAA